MMPIGARLAPRLSAAVILLLCTLGCGGKKTPTEPVPTDSQYNIEIRFYGPEPSAQVKAAFEAAQARIQKMVTADLAATRIDLDLSGSKSCNVPAQMHESVDDLVIYATVKTIDGVGQVVASSGPCLVRSTTQLPVVGTMEMDVDDLNQLANTGRLDAVVLHEMLHVLGFGTIWEQVNPKRVTGTNTDDARFTGPAATQACAAAGGASVCASSVPVESCVGIPNCGTGTRDSHWRETVFRTELMTGFIEARNVKMPLSAMSILSLADLGYSVTTADADPYQVPAAALRMQEPTEPLPVWENMRRPVFQVTPEGRITQTH